MRALPDYSEYAHGYFPQCWPLKPEPERSPNSGVIIGNSVGRIADGKVSETPRKRYAIPAVLRSASLVSRRQLICSTGALTKILSSFRAKNISVFQKLKSVYSWLVPLRHKGRTRRHERGAECSGRERADRRTAYSRTAKSCGPGAPMQALSCRGNAPRASRERRWQTSNGSPRRARSKP